MAFWTDFQKKSFLAIFWLNLINQDKIEVYNVKIAKNFKLHKIWTLFFLNTTIFGYFLVFLTRQTDRHTENLWRWVIQLKPIKLIGKTLLFHHSKKILSVICFNSTLGRMSIFWHPESDSDPGSCQSTVGYDVNVV